MKALFTRRKATAEEAQNAININQQVPAQPQSQNIPQQIIPRAPQYQPNQLQETQQPQAHAQAQPMPLHQAIQQQRMPEQQYQYHEPENAEYLAKKLLNHIAGLESEKQRTVFVLALIENLIFEQDHDWDAIHSRMHIIVHDMDQIISYNIKENKKVEQ